MAVIRIVDTTLRDGNQSLWACRMSVEDMAPVADDLDAAGYDGIEFFVASAQIARMVRDLRENPWAWLEASDAFERTPLRLHGSMHSAFSPTPKCIQDLFLERIVELGITATRASDPWNDAAGLQRTMTRMAAKGIETIANVIYSVSPRHTAEYYADRTARIAALQPLRLCFKDVGGLLTPEAVRTILPVVLEHADGIPVELHVHCTNGLAQYVCLEAVDLGVEIVHTALPPLAEGSSLPSLFSLVDSLHARGHQVEVDTERLRRASRHFEAVARLRGFPVGKPQVYDETFYEHQTPGGMISNLEFQLQQLGVRDRLPEVLHEIAHVRADLGYPIMVTPLSQFVGSQAVLNLVSGERYGTVTDEVIGYALGRWGSEAPKAMDPEVRARILDRPRAAEVEAHTPEEPTLDEVRQRYPSGISDEELIVRAFAGVGDAPLGWNGARPVPHSYEEWEALHSPLVRVVENLVASTAQRFTVALPDAGIRVRGVR
jgi:oxaloacetate decarboxylase alpha subunit